MSDKQDVCKVLHVALDLILILTVLFLLDDKTYTLLLLYKDFCLVTILFYPKEYWVPLLNLECL